ncbi:hypothetical protein BN946_scf184938.g49 [Trametes cinnabarina]|uniref:Velvet domain-containing protein n=1 Tax=Pycnoporus cinnabarinus TaxID=5643 RepID=A0A060S1F4_PYCCI|nr:hypothetical protein BN946_scf184938.g49 [Trametes cinnabarina]
MATLLSFNAPPSSSTNVPPWGSADHDIYPRPLAVPSHIGQPVRFDAGLLAQRTIRVELQEIQKADLGRKYARKDKRPLDPPPVVVCRFFELINRGDGLKPVEVELDPDEHVMLGALCHVDLFPVPSVPEKQSTSGYNEGPTAHDYRTALPPLQTGGPFALSPLHVPQMFPPPSLLFDIPGAAFPAPSRGLSGPSPFFSAFQRQPPSPAGRYGSTAEDSDIVAWFDMFPIRESSRCTVMLAGATFVEASVIDYKGKRTAMFAFSDLAVKIEGTFVLRYRMLSVFSQRAMLPRMPILSQCYGGIFKVYSTKDFPGLKASTDLTKHLALYGVRVNLRDTPRKRRKKSEIIASRGAHGARSQSRHRGGDMSSDHDDEDEDEEDEDVEDEGRRAFRPGSMASIAGWLPAQPLASGSGTGFGATMDTSPSSPGPPSAPSSPSYYSPTMSVGSFSFASVAPYPPSPTATRGHCRYLLIPPVSARFGCRSRRARRAHALQGDSPVLLPLRPVAPV